ILPRPRREEALGSMGLFPVRVVLLVVLAADIEFAGDKERHEGGEVRSRAPPRALVAIDNTRLLGLRSEVKGILPSIGPVCKPDEVRHARGLLGDAGVSEEICE